MTTQMFPDLASYDVILVNSSAGKDSQAMLDYLVELADLEGLRDRMVVVHCDLGRVEWEGTRELAETQTAHYGIRFEVVARDRDLLHQIEFERKKFPDSARRYCTSDQKTSQVAKLITRLGVEGRHLGRPVRILNCLGMRGQESAARAKKPVHSVERTSKNVHVDRWLPIHSWTEDQVWARIKESGVPSHPAYAAGMPRLSCCFCVLSSRSALTLAAQLNPTLAAEYVRIEISIGHRFRKDLSIAEVVADAERLSDIAVESWSA